MLYRLAANVLRWFTGRQPGPPEDPYASVRQPIHRGPPARPAAIALDEPVVRRRVRAFGLRLPGRA